MQLLAAADALLSLSGHRRQQVWDASGLRSKPLLLREAPILEDHLEMQASPEGEEVVFDYATLGLTLRSHPLALLRPQLARRGLLTAEELQQRVPNGKRVRYAGIVTVRQQPSTANGTVFLSLEDESGSVQAIVWKSVRDGQRKELLGSRLMEIEGRWQRDGLVCNLVAERLNDLSSMLGRIADLTTSGDFR